MTESGEFDGTTSDEAPNSGAVPQAARPVGTTADPSRRAVSATGDAEYLVPGTEPSGGTRPFASSSDSPLESDVTQHVPSGGTEPTAEPGAPESAADVPESDPTVPESETMVPDADPDEDLAAGPPDGR